MNILVICHDHPHYTTGGTEILSHDLYKAYGTKGVNATFLAATTGLSRPDMPAGTIARLGDDYLLRTGRYDMFTMARMDGIAWVASVKQIVRETKPDIIHLHGLDRLGADIITLLRRILPQASLVLTLHDYQLICPNEGLLLTRPDAALCHRPAPEACNRCFNDLSIDRHALRKAHLLGVLRMVDAFIAPSVDLKARFVAWGLEADRIHQIGNGVPELQQTPARTVDTTDRPRNRFAYFGQFSAHKGIYTLLDAARRLQANSAALRLSLHGRMFHPSKQAQSRFNHSMQMAEPLAQNLGSYDRSELASLISGSDWVVLPSLWFENAPLTVLEAQRIGRPVICTDIGGLGELVQDGVNGLCVPRGNAAALAEAMAMAASDVALWDRLASGVQPPPSTATVADQHLSLFDRLNGKAAA